VNFYQIQYNLQVAKIEDVLNQLLPGDQLLSGDQLLQGGQRPPQHNFLAIQVKYTMNKQRKDVLLSIY